MTATLPAAELDTLRDELRGLGADSIGNYALIQDAHLVSVWSTYEEALQEGYRAFESDSFFIRQITPLDPCFSPDDL